MNVDGNIDVVRLRNRHRNSNRYLNGIGNRNRDSNLYCIRFGN